MYIGPWQEYSLSKQRKGNDGTVELKKGIEAAIASSLDPTAAQAAIEAMETYFKQHQGTNTFQLPNIHPNETQRRHRNNLYHPSAFKEDSTKLPTLDTYMTSPLSSSSRYRMISSARDKIPSAGASPMSVRSTKSEPISAMKLPSLFPNASNNTKQLSLHSSMNNSDKRKVRNNRNIGIAGTELFETGVLPMMEMQKTQPKNDRKTLPPTGTSLTHDYDTSSAMGILRLERSERARAEINKITGWKQSTKNVTLDESLKITRPPKPKDGHGKDPMKDEKLEHIKHMKDMYLANQLMTNSQKVSTTTTNEKSISPKQPATTKSGIHVSSHLVKEDHIAVTATAASMSPPLGSPRIQDMDVTESDLLYISKYFKTVSGGSESTKHITQSRASMTTFREEEEIAMEQAEHHSMNGSKKKWDANHGNDVQQQSTAMPFLENSSSQKSSSTASTKPAVFADSPYVDDLYNGIGADSLLKWTAQLDFDDF